MPTDVGPAQVSGINQNQPADPGHCQSYGNRRTNRSAAKDGHRCVPQRLDARILAAAMHPLGIDALDDRAVESRAPDEAVRKQDLRRLSWAEAVREAFSLACPPDLVNFWRR